jgi:hypothetical protein
LPEFNKEHVVDFETLAAQAFVGEFGSGSTKPCVFLCDTLAGATAGEYVVKFRSTVRGGENGLCFEFLAAQLAAIFDIKSPKPALIQFDAQLAESINDSAVRERVHRSLGLNFGTEYKTPGYTTWPKGDPIPPPLRQLAAEIVAFDVLIDNPDRRALNPNILYKNDEIMVIDHETAFAFTRLVGQSSGAGSVDRIEFIYEHPFYAGLRGTALELDRFASRVSRLTDQEIAAILASVPVGFGTNYVAHIGAHLTAARDRIGSMLDAIRRILQ